MAKVTACDHSAGQTSDWMKRFEDEGFATDDFVRIYREQYFNWKENYTQRPIDVLKNK